MDDEVAIRQQLIQVALAKEDADLILRGATTLNVFSSTWMPDQEIVIRGKRIAGRSGQWRGNAEVVDVRGLWAVPGFGESHKHIENAAAAGMTALVVPGGNMDSRGITRTFQRSWDEERRILVSSGGCGESSENLSSYWLSSAPYVYEKAGGTMARKCVPF